MARPRRATCRICERPVEEVGRLSARGKCEGCGRDRMNGNYDQLRAHAGEHFEHWRRRGAASYGATLLDDL